MANKRKKDNKEALIFGLVLIGIAFVLILFYYVIFPVTNPEIGVPCTVNIIISTLLAFGTAFAIKLVENKR